MSDREILEKYIDLDKSCLIDKEKKQVMDMLYKNKEAFSLRDEMGTCLTQLRSGNRCDGQISILY